ncbi:MAG TPA: hypothetical protein DCP28_37820, partial [Cytophagales bacterium]|nr:hypothetical protein [Cytophagales bacterium]
SLDGVGAVSSGPGYEDARAGDIFAIYGDDLTANSQMTLGTNAELWAWSGGASMLVAVTSPYGDSALSFTFPAATWSGMGFNSSDVMNLSNFIGGTLRFKAKTSSQEPFRIHSWTRTGGREIVWGYGEEAYGLVRDGQWHDVEIPLDLFVDNLYEVIRPFQLGE